MPPAASPVGRAKEKRGSGRQMALDSPRLNFRVSRVSPHGFERQTRRISRAPSIVVLMGQREGNQKRARWPVDPYQRKNSFQDRTIRAYPFCCSASTSTCLAFWNMYIHTYERTCGGERKQTTTAARVCLACCPTKRKERATTGSNRVTHRKPCACFKF